MIKESISKIESVLNHGLYGREEEIRLAILCALGEKSLFLYGHDDVNEIELRINTLFGEGYIKTKAEVGAEYLKSKKMNKHIAYCSVGNHDNSNSLYKYLFAQNSNTNILAKLKQLEPEAQKIKKYFQDYDFNTFWSEENKNKAIDFMESVTSYANPVGDENGDSTNHISKQLSEVSDRRFKDFLHILAINLIINDKKEVDTMDFGMFFYCLRDWSSGTKYLESIIFSNISSQNLPTFVFHDSDYDKIKKEEFLEKFKKMSYLIPNVEFIFYVPYSSSPNTAPHDIFVKIDKFYAQYSNLTKDNNSDDIEKDLKELREKERILKDAQTEEMDIKESHLAQVQLKRSAFKNIKDSIDNKLKIAVAKESEFREQREALETKLRDTKIKAQTEGLEAQIADIKAKEEQYTEIREDLESQLQDAKNNLEGKLNQIKDILGSKALEVKEKEAELKRIQDIVKQKMSNKKGKLETKLKDAKDYLSQLRSVTAVLNKAIDSCQKQIDIAPKPNPIWSRTLKIHLKGLRRIQKSLPNMIKIFDEQIKKYEEDSKKSVKV